MKNIVIQMMCFLTILSLTMSCGKQQKAIDCSLVYGTLVDPRDGSRYSTVDVCDQVWVTQNIRYDLPGAIKTPASLEVEYGYLYNFEQASKACPENWHLATDKDWKALETVLGMLEENIDKTGWRGEEIGQYLKSSTKWKGEEKIATPISFRALPAGYSDGTHQGLEKNARYWTASEADGETAWIRELGLGEKKIKRSVEKKTDFNSCRCVLD